MRDPMDELAIQVRADCDWIAKASDDPLTERVVAARREAIWERRFHVDAHWGDHAIDALRALDRACNLSRVPGLG